MNGFLTSKKFFLVGILIGIIHIFLSYLIIYFMDFNNFTFKIYNQFVFSINNMYLIKLISKTTLILNIISFVILVQLKKENIYKGLFIITLLIGLFTIYFHF